MLTTLLAAGSFLCSTQGAREELATALRATRERGSFQARIEELRVEERFNTVRSAEGTLVWQQPNLARVQRRSTSAWMAGDSPPPSPSDLVAAGANVWRKEGEAWRWSSISFADPEAVQIPWSDPLAFLQTLLDRADSVLSDEPRLIQGTSYTRYSFFLNASDLDEALRAALGEQGRWGAALASDECSAQVEVLVGRENRLVRQCVIHMHLHVSIPTGADGGAQRVTREFIAVEKMTLSRFGESRVEIPSELADDVGRADR